MLLATEKHSCISVSEIRINSYAKEKHPAHLRDSRTALSPFAQPIPLHVWEGFGIPPLSLANGCAAFCGKVLFARCASTLT